MEQTPCPEGVAEGAFAVVWAVSVIAVGLWVARGLARPDCGEATDLQLIDRAFDHKESIKSEDEQ